MITVPENPLGRRGGLLLDALQRNLVRECISLADNPYNPIDVGTVKACAVEYEPDGPDPARTTPCRSRQGAGDDLR